MNAQPTESKPASSESGAAQNPPSRTDFKSHTDTGDAHIPQKTSKSRPAWQYIVWAILAVVFVLFVTVFEIYTHYAVKQENDRYAQLMQDFLWNLNTRGAEESLTLIAHAAGYPSIRLLKDNGQEFIQVRNPDALGTLSKLLRYAALVRINTTTSPVNYRGQPIGQLETRWVNTNIYVYMYALVMVALLGLIARYYLSIIENRRALAAKNSELNQEITERRRAMEQVQNLKIQQDGDYFLMTLLTRPLTGDHHRSETVTVQSLVKEKKQFVFRQRHAEIGGDICISHSLELYGRPYTVFINADAMGKSMQGAGGVLVLGSVFKTIIDRTQQTHQGRHTYPEQWINHTFVELNTVFESFDGSMLVSCVLGLIDDMSGLLYYINAEHPFSVLYREGRADFTEDQLSFRKLGVSVPGANQEVWVRTMQLQPGDVMILGSDGRDDLIMRDESGETYINEDERLFLTTVEQSEGQIQAIYDRIHACGEPMDDLSLMRLAYLEEGVGGKPDYKPDAIVAYADARRAFLNENYESALQLLERAHALDSTYPEPLRLLTKLLLKSKKYAEVIESALKYHELNPADGDFLYILSYGYMKTGAYRRAADFGERLRLRMPDHLKNLMNLAEVYLALGNIERARKMIEKSLELDTENVRARKIQEKLNASIATGNTT